MAEKLCKHVTGLFKKLAVTHVRKRMVCLQSNKTEQNARNQTYMKYHSYKK